MAATRQNFPAGSGDAGKGFVYDFATDRMVLAAPLVTNVKDPPYNAKGDGTTDDTAAFQNALATGLSVFVPEPSSFYKISGPLSVYGAGQKLLGINSRKCRIVQYATNTPIVVVGQGPLANQGDRQEIAGLQLEYAATPSAGHTNSIGIRMENLVFGSIHDIYVLNSYTGIQSPDVGGGNQNSVISTNFYNIRILGYQDRGFDATAYLTGATGCSVVGLYVGNNLTGPLTTANWGVTVVNCQDWVLSQINVEHGHFNNAPLATSGAEGVTFQGLHFEGCHTAGFYGFINNYDGSVIFDGINIVYSTTPASGACVAVVGPGSTTMIRMLKVRNNTLGGAFPLLSASGTPTGAVVEVHRVVDPGAQITGEQNGTIPVADPPIIRRVGDKNYMNTAQIVATASLPAAAAAMDGRILIEDGGAGVKNTIVYAGGQRFRISGGTAF